MSVYRWRARDKRGEKFCGELRAGGEKEVADFIQSNYGYVTKIEEVKHWSNLDLGLKMTNSEFNDGNREKFFRQLTELLDSGMPLLKGLELMQAKSKGRMFEICNSLRIGLNKGLSLAGAMRKQKDDFTAASVRIIEAGEDSGSLSVLLDELADYYKHQNELKRFARNACIYPCIVVTLTVCTSIFFACKVLPLFMGLYSSLGIEQTPVLKMIGFVLEEIERYRWEAACFFLFFLGEIYCQREQIKEGCLRLPVLKGCYREMMEIRYCRVLSIMLKSGIAIPVALTAAAEALQSREMNEKSIMASFAVTRGASISQAVALNGELFSDTSIEFISVGEESGSLPEMLLQAADVVDEELQAQLKNLKEVMEPMLLLLISLLVGCVIYSMASPMFGLIAGMPDYL